MLACHFIDQFSTISLPLVVLPQQLAIFSILTWFSPLPTISLCPPVILPSSPPSLLFPFLFLSISLSLFFYLAYSLLVVVLLHVFFSIRSSSSYLFSLLTSHLYASFNTATFTFTFNPQQILSHSFLFIFVSDSLFFSLPHYPSLSSNHTIFKLPRSCFPSNFLFHSYTPPLSFSPNLPPNHCQTLISLTTWPQLYNYLNC